MSTPTFLLVHGTFAAREQWPEMEAELRSERPGSNIEYFDWSGKNTFQEREVAAKQLPSRIRELAANGPLTIVAHSHGGNIVALALRDRELRRLVDSIVFLSTPFLCVSRPGVQPEGVKLLKFSWALWLLFCVVALPLPWWLQAPVYVAVTALVSAWITATSLHAVEFVDRARLEPLDGCRCLIITAPSDEARLVLVSAQFGAWLTSRDSAFLATVGSPKRPRARPKEKGSTLTMPKKTMPRIDQERVSTWATLGKLVGVSVSFWLADRVSNALGFPSHLLDAYLWSRVIVLEAALIGSVALAKIAIYLGAMLVLAAIAAIVAAIAFLVAGAAAAAGWQGAKVAVRMAWILALPARQMTANMALLASGTTIGVSPFVEISIEACPPGGQYSVCLLDAPIRWNHSTHSDPRALAIIRGWLRSDGEAANTEAPI